MRYECCGKFYGFQFHLEVRNFQGKFSLQPDALTNTFVIGYRTIGEFVRNVTRKMSRAAVVHGDDEYENLNGEELSPEDLNDVRSNEIKLLIASSIVNEIRATVKAKTGYECSAGIGHNKILAKIVCGLNKPNKQTLLPIKRIAEFYKFVTMSPTFGIFDDFLFPSFTQNTSNKKDPRPGWQVRRSNMQ